MSEELRNRVVAVLVGIVALGSGAAVDRILFKANAAQERRHTQELLSSKYSILQIRLNQVLHLPVGLGALVQSHKQSGKPLGEDEFVSFSGALAKNYPSIRRLQLAPLGRVQFIYPLRGNEHMLGLNLLTRGASRVAALRARDSRNMVVEGPTPQALGDRALIVHYPIFLAPTESDQPLSFWGYASVVLDFATVLEQAGLRSANDGARIAIRTSGSANQPGERIFGAEKVFESHPVEMVLELPHATWRLAAIPRDGWSGSWPGRVWLAVAVGVVAVLLGTATWRLLDQARRLGVNERIFRELALHDGLTGLHNRRGLDELLDREWARCHRSGKEISVIMCDIDFFKQYNDAYGHAAGDECLRNVARIISESRRRATDVVARFGGEEFIVVLPEVDAAGAVHIAETMRRNVLALDIAHSASPFRRVTISAGIAAMVPGDKKYPGDLLAEADFGLYGAKQRGRNQVLIKRPEGAGAPAAAKIEERRAESTVGEVPQRPELRH